MPRRLSKQAARLNTNVLAVNIAVLCLIFSSFLSNYINSSYIQQFISSEAVGLIYTVASAMTILVFLFISRVLHKVGNYHLTLGALVADFVCLLGLAFADSLRTAIPLFIAHLLLINLIFFNFDIFLEEAIGRKESTTGSRRAILLASSSLVGALTPLLSGLLVGEENYSYAYYAGAIALLPIIALVGVRFKRINTKRQNEVKVFKALRSFWVERDIRHVFLSNLLLWLFFCFMVVYVPLYLSTEMEFSWREIGVVLFIAQLAYIMFEPIIGRLADRYIGEREMMAVGFLILSASTATLTWFTESSVLVWGIGMFITRIGASLVEVTTESYFFKHTKGADGQIISFFRMANPVAYIGGPLVASLALLYLPFEYLFIVIALILLAGAHFALQLKDTK